MDMPGPFKFYEDTDQFYDYGSSTESTPLPTIASLATTLNDICGNYSCINSTGISDDSDPGLIEIAKWLGIIVPILFGIIVIVGLFGNALVVIVVACNPQMRSTTNLLIINLAIADLLFIVFCVPFTAWDYAFPFWPFGNIWCKIVQYLIVVCAYASIYTVS